jgi:hypothetical protein
VKITGFNIYVSGECGELLPVSLLPYALFRQIEAEIPVFRTLILSGICVNMWYYLYRLCGLVPDYRS